MHNMPSLLSAVVLGLGALQAVVGTSDPDVRVKMPTLEAVLGNNTLIYDPNLPPLTFNYTIEQDLVSDSNWMGIWNLDDTSAPGMTGDESYVAWAWARGASGTVQLNYGNCSVSGDFQAYIVQYGSRQPPLTEPTLVNYQAFKNYKDCNGNCVPNSQVCCLSTQQVCNGVCIASGQACPTGILPGLDSLISAILGLPTSTAAPSSQSTTTSGQNPNNTNQNTTTTNQSTNTNTTSQNTTGVIQTGNCVASGDLCCLLGKVTCGNTCILPTDKCCPSGSTWCANLGSCIASTDPCCPIMTLGGVARLDNSQCWGRCYIGSTPTSTWCQVSTTDSGFWCPFGNCVGRVQRSGDVPCQANTTCGQM